MTVSDQSRRWPTRSGQLILPCESKSSLGDVFWVVKAVAYRRWSTWFVLASGIRCYWWHFVEWLRWGPTERGQSDSLRVQVIVSWQFCFRVVMVSESGQTDSLQVQFVDRWISAEWLRWVTHSKWSNWLFARAVRWQMTLFRVSESGSPLGRGQTACSVPVEIVIW